MKETIQSAKHRTGLVTLVIPAKNEAAAIGATLNALPIETLHAAGFGTEVIILDGNSRDGTAAIAARHGATVLTDLEPGKGSAFRNGRSFFRGDYVVMLDADGTYATDAIPRLVSRLAWGDADIVMGLRRTRPGAMSMTHRIGNRVLSLGASVLYGRVCPDVCTGLWGFQRDALNALPLTSRGFELEAELFGLTCRLGLRVVHVPVDYLPRMGETKLSSGRDGIRIGWCLLRTRLTRPGVASGQSEPAMVTKKGEERRRDRPKMGGAERQPGSEDDERHHGEMDARVPVEVYP
jgi:dolichol-phosphate hexosyltransferase